MAERRVTADGRILEKRDDGSVVQVGTQGGGQGISATPLPRNPDVVRAEEEDRRRENREESYDRGDRTFDNTAKLRSEFGGLPSVSEYRVALRTFNTALNTPTTPEGDQALITSFARLMDPNSVVREGEFATAAENESAFKRLRAQIAKEFGVEGAGRLTEQGRDRLRQTMRGVVVDGFKAEYDRDRQQYQRLAQMEGIEPFKVVGDPVEAAYPANLLDPPKIEENLTVADGNVEAEKLPQAYQDAHYAYMQQNWGDVDPQEYAEFRSSLDERYKLTPDPAAYAEFAPRANEVAQQGGSPADLGVVPSPTSQMGLIERQLNSAAQTPEGAFFANAGNALAGGLPVALSGNQDRLRDIRDINPGASFAGELAGGVAGTMAGGSALANAGAKIGGRFGTILANPLIADAAYGGTYGATQSEDPLTGAATGVGAALGGGFLGRQIAKGFPSLFNRSGVQAADATVPPVEDLQATATQQYQAAQAAGQAADPAATADIIARSNAIAAQAGRVGPKGDVVGSGPVTDALNLVRQYDGQSMTPIQADATRKAIGEGRMAMNGTQPDYSQRRVAGQMLDEFDQWAQPVMPGVEQARATAQRAILGREMQGATDVAEAKSAMFTQSGEENALRNAYRNLDLSEVRGRNSYPPELSSAIQDVSRGTPMANASRWLGKLAPTGAIPIMASLGTGGLASASLGGLTGAAVAGGTMAAGGAGRAIATGLTKRAAEVAELTARGGPEYQALLDEAYKLAMDKGTRFGGGLFGAGGVSYANR